MLFLYKSVSLIYCRKIGPFLGLPDSFQTLQEAIACPFKTSICTSMSARLYSVDQWTADTVLDVTQGISHTITWTKPCAVRSTPSAQMQRESHTCVVVEATRAQTAWPRFNREEVVTWYGMPPVRTSESSHSHICAGLQLSYRFSCCWMVQRLRWL